MKKSDMRWRSSPYNAIVVALIIAMSWRTAGAEQAIAPRQTKASDEALDDQICKVIRADQKSDPAEMMQPFDDCKISEITSATGDSAKTILADVGGLGASTDLIVVYRLNHGITAAARFKDRKGRVWEGGGFSEGSSVTHSSSVTLSPSQQALFTSSITGINEEGLPETCEVHAYQWTPRVGMYVERASRKTDEIRCTNSR